MSPPVVVTDITYEGCTKDEVAKYIEEKEKQPMLGRVGRPEDINNVVDEGGTYYLTHAL